MPRRICPTCRGEHGWFKWSQTVSDYVCHECAQVNREVTARERENALQREADDAEQARQMEITRTQIEAGMRKTQEEEETKRTNHAKDVETALRRTREEEETKRLKDEKEFEVEKEKIEAEKQAKVMQEKTKQIQAEWKAEITKGELDFQIAQEKTKQAKIQADVDMKRIEAEQKAKQMIADKETLAHCDSIVASLVKGGSDKVFIESLLSKMLDFTVPPPEKVGKGHFPSIHNSSQLKFLAALTKEKEPSKAGKRNNIPPHRSVQTAPVCMHSD